MHEITVICPNCNKPCKIVEVQPEGIVLLAVTVTCGTRSCCRQSTFVSPTGGRYTILNQLVLKVHTMKDLIHGVIVDASSWFQYPVKNHVIVTWNYKRRQMCWEFGSPEYDPKRQARRNSQYASTT